MKYTAILAISAAFLAGSAAAATTTGGSATTTTASTGVERTSSAPIYNQPVVQGCFSSAGDLVFNSSQQYNSQGLCGGEICQALGYWVAATTKGKECYCGNSYPPESTLANDTDCNTPCSGYDQDACGGVGYWTVYNTGVELYDVPYANDTSSSSSSSSTSTSSSASNGQTVFVTQTGDSSATTTAGSSGKSSNTAGIAAGVVVGVAAAAGLAGAAVFYMRRRRNREIEDEHRRNAAANDFFGKSNGSGGFSNDTRLDPVMVQRRMSDGSIADNQDYSRKILRVTNA